MNSVVQLIWIGLLFLIFLLFLIYLVNEQQWEIKKELFKDSKFPLNHSLSLVWISDLHLGWFLGLRKLQRLIQTINQLQPDIVVWGGDLVGWGFNHLKIGALNNIMKSLKSPLKLAIFGNHDKAQEGRLWEIYNHSGITVLMNQGIQYQAVYFYGYDDALRGDPQDPSTHPFNIHLSHEPKTPLSSTQPLYQLSGHSHGGQIVLPFIGRLYKAKMTKHYWRGRYPLSNGAIYVSKGVGYHGIPLRMNARPEISLIQFQKE